MRGKRLGWFRAHGASQFFLRSNGGQVIKTYGFNYSYFNFPVGEMHVNCTDLPKPGSYVRIEFAFQKNEEIILLLLIVNALKNAGITVSEIELPYVPFSRQDRINVKGECFSLQLFCDILNSIKAEKVIISDPHSDVTSALINNCHIVYQHEIFKHYFEGKKDFYLVCPDGGALKKIYKLADIVKPLAVIECSKRRDVGTGQIIGVKVYSEKLNGSNCFIVDDICDGGRTFIEIAKELRLIGASKITLMVTHGFFTKGLNVFDNLIDEIYTREGKIK